MAHRRTLLLQVSLQNLGEGPWIEVLASNLVFLQISPGRVPSASQRTGSVSTPPLRVSGPLLILAVPGLKFASHLVG